MAWSIAAVLLAVVTAMMPARATAEPARPLRFVTFNMLHGGPLSGLRGNGDELEARLSLTVTGLRALDPDVIALQEASVARGRGNLAERLAQALGLHHVHAPSTERFAPFALLGRFLVTVLGFNEGPAVLSRFPIVASEVYDLPGCVKRIDPRVLLRAELATPWGPIDAFSTHISRDDCQLRRVAEIIGGRRGRAPSVVMGDFNSSETSETIAALLREATLIDAFRAVNPAEAGFTVWQRIRNPEPTVFRRVDYIFVMPGRELRARVRESRVVLNEPHRIDGDRSLWPSDHYGVLADLDLFAR